MAQDRFSCFELFFLAALFRPLEFLNDRNEGTGYGRGKVFFRGFPRQ
jgi:hypothetical protein